jgi:hypothetical protein
VEKTASFAGKSEQIFGNHPQVSRRFCHFVCILQVGIGKLTIREIIAEQRRRLSSADPAERLAAALLIPGVLAKRLRLLGDGQIGQLLEDEVWSRMNLLAPESTICLVAVDRLRRHVNGTPERKRFGIRRRAGRSWAAERDEGTHLLTTEVALYRGGVPFLQLPWQMNRFASSTFMVMNIAEARACLLQAGFRETQRCSTALIDSRTRQAIQLYEDSHNSAQAKS